MPHFNGMSIGGSSLELLVFIQALFGRLNGLDALDLDNLAEKLSLKREGSLFKRESCKCITSPSAGPMSAFHPPVNSIANTQSIDGAEPKSIDNFPVVSIFDGEHFSALTLALSRETAVKAAAAEWRKGGMDGSVVGSLPSFFLPIPSPRLASHRV